MLGRLGKFVTRPFDRAVERFLPPPAMESHSPECIEMRPLADLRKQTYATVSFEDLQAAAEREDRAAAAAAAAAGAGASTVRVPSPPPLLLCVLRAALEILAKPFKSQALQRAFTAEQRFLTRRVCSRFRRVLWIGRATLFWGVLLTLVSSCGVVLALTGDLGKLLGQQPRIWYVKFGTYLTSYFTVLHVAQVICAVLLLIAVKMAETSPLRIRDPTVEECWLWVFSLGLLIVTKVNPPREPVTSPSECPPTPASLPVSSPGRTSAVLQVQAQVEHNPDGRRPTAYIRSPSSARIEVPVASDTIPSTSKEPATGKSQVSPLSSLAESSIRNHAGDETTERKPTKGSSLDAILQSLIEELKDESSAGARNKPASKRFRLRTPWLWVSAVSLATYAITAVALYCSGTVAIPTSLCAIIVLATPCILDVLAEVLGVSEEVSEDLEQLFGPGPSYESIMETGQAATAASPRGQAQGDRTRQDSPSSKLNEATCLLRLK